MEQKYEYSDNQRTIIYEQMLVPLKFRISQIVLYDTAAATIFLNKLNEMLQYKGNDRDIISQIVELEFELKQYQKENRRSITSEQVKTLLQNMDDIYGKLSTLSVEELEQAIEEIQKKIELNSFEYDDMDEIESHLYRIKARTLEKRVLEGDTNLTDNISLKDEVGIRIAITEEIAELQKHDSPATQLAASQLKSKIHESNGNIYDIQLYRMLNAARYGIALNPILEQNTSLAVINKKQGLFARIKNLIRPELKLPTTIDDLNQITLNWLANHVLPQNLPKDENGFAISPQMFILKKWDEYAKEQWNLSNRYNRLPDFEDELRYGESAIRIYARGITGNFRKWENLE